jgi:putative transposase
MLARRARVHLYGSERWGSSPSERAADSAPRPDHPAADLSRQRIKRRAIFGGLLSEYQPAA